MVDVGDLFAFFIFPIHFVAKMSSCENINTDRRFAVIR